MDRGAWQAIVHGIASRTRLSTILYIDTGGASGKEPACPCKRLKRRGFHLPGLGRSLGGEHSNPLQCYCLENPMDREAWRATVHGVTELDTAVVIKHTHIHRHVLHFWERRLCIRILLQ